MIMEIEEAKKDFQELCDLAEKFMKKYGSEGKMLIITNEEIKIVDNYLFKKFEVKEK